MNFSLAATGMPLQAAVSLVICCRSAPLSRRQQDRPCILEISQVSVAIGVCASLSNSAHNSGSILLSQSTVVLVMFLSHSVSVLRSNVR